MTGMDKLVDALCGLAASWEEQADTAARLGPLFGNNSSEAQKSPMLEQAYRNAAKELRDVLAKHKVGQWL